MLQPLLTFQIWETRLSMPNRMAVEKTSFYAQVDHLTSSLSHYHHSIDTQAETHLGSFSLSAFHSVTCFEFIAATTWNTLCGAVLPTNWEFMDQWFGLYLGEPFQRLACSLFRIFSHNRKDQQLRGQSIQSVRPRRHRRWTGKLPEIEKLLPKSLRKFNFITCPPAGRIPVN